MRKDILQYHRYQSTWFSCAAVGLSIPSDMFGFRLPPEMEIHNHIYDPYFDGSPPNRILKFCQENDINCKLHKNLTLENAQLLTSDGYVLLMLVKDYFPDSFKSDPEGHYLLLKNIEFGSEKLTFVDPSKARRYYKDGIVLTQRNGKPFETRPEYQMRLGDLAWVDELQNGSQAERWALAFGSKNST